MIRLKTVPLAVITVATIFGGIVIAKSVGYYETTSSKQPVKFKTGELAGLPNPADIRGSYTWNDIERVFGVPAAQAAAAFSVPGQALEPAERVSVLESMYAEILPAGLEIGTGAVRLFVSLYTGLPMEAEEGSVLPPAALAMLAVRPGLDAETLRRYAIPGTTNPGIVEIDAPAAAPFTAPAMGTGTAAGSSSGGGGGGGGSGSGTSSVRAVVGRTTYGDLYSWGLTEAQVEAVTGFKPGARTQTVREAAAAAGIEFSAFKTALQELVDKSTP